MDIYAEATIHRQLTRKPKAIQNFFFAFFVLMLFLALRFHLLFLIPTFIFFLMYRWTRKNLDLEYDYTLVNNELDIDRVLGGKARRRMVTINLGQVLVLAPLGAPELERHSKLLLKDYSAADPENPPYIAICAVEGGGRRFALQLNHEMLELIRKQIPSKVITK